MEPSALVPVAAAIVGAIALLLASDLLTAKGRLQRKLDKEQVIADRLPIGGRARKDMESLVRRHALELFHREQRENAGPLIALSFSLFGIFVVYVMNAYIAMYPGSEQELDPATRYVRPGATGVFTFFLLCAVALTYFQKRARDRYVKCSADQRTPRPLGPTRRRRPSHRGVAAGYHRARSARRS